MYVGWSVCLLSAVSQVGACGGVAMASAHMLDSWRLPALLKRQSALMVY